MQSTIPWTAKYAPKDLHAIQGQQAAVEQLRSFVNDRKKGNLCLLYGPQGVGKTSLVHAFARSMDAELLEVNASDVRNESAINEILGPALKQQSLFARTKIILFDEVDGLSGSNDRGGLSALLRLAKETTYPVIMTANDPWDSKFSELRKQSVMINVRSLAYTSIVPVLRSIAAAEGVVADDESLKAIARRAGGDLRAAITDLQTLGSAISLEKVDTLTQRDVADSILNALRLVFKTKDPAIARKALDGVQEDIDEIFLWMDENLPKEYKKPEDIRRAYDIFSKADVFRGRILRWQHWRFLVYCYDLLGPGIALAKEEKYDGFTQLGPTQRILALWRAKSAKRDAIVLKLSTMQHISKKQARFEMRILKPVLKDATFLDDEEKDWLSAK